MGAEKSKSEAWEVLRACLPAGKREAESQREGWLVDILAPRRSLLSKEQIPGVAMEKGVNGHESKKRRAVEKNTHTRRRGSYRGGLSKRDRNFGGEFATAPNTVDAAGGRKKAETQGGVLRVERNPGRDGIHP